MDLWRGFSACLCELHYPYTVLFKRRLPPTRQIIMGYYDENKAQAKEKAINASACSSSCSSVYLMACRMCAFEGLDAFK